MGHRWSKAEKDKLREIVPGHYMHEIRDSMEREFGWRPSVSQIKNMRTSLGLLSGIKDGFKEGHIPHNKGKHYDPGGRSGETRFKIGNRPPQYLPVGSKRVTRDGYHMTKVEDPNKWEMTHKIIYEKHFGKIPDGEFVIFLDKDKNNLNIENLVSVTRSQLARINQRRILDYPNELKRTAIILVKLEEKVKKG